MTEDDKTIVARILPMLKRHKGFSEKRIFGGVCFMINGNMYVGPWTGSLVVRLDKENHDEKQSKPHVKPMEITGKVMKDWTLIEPAGIKF
ncbi:TfoX/Sxy family protein [Bythopirellula polymerisocia]|uniref:TfoX N-terminal domain-containing protein n=1 Tax=Bythopirellula polymerisocia TaxID=2528003 RepID=A0A5C6CDE6_9BACT|nr:TfoX/Sxy family protein [Bythopirellula polymerisocia]TWU20839.1 hypothetical protein Pla144_47380 [Bythopirellula polymerisocia]